MKTYNFIFAGLGVAMLYFSTVAFTGAKTETLFEEDVPTTMYFETDNIAEAQRFQELLTTDHMRTLETQRALIKLKIKLKFKNKKQGTEVEVEGSTD